MRIRLRKRSILPGFGLTFGFSMSYLSLIVLIPLLGLVVKAAQLSWTEWWRTATDSRVLAAYRLSFGASLGAAVANVVFGGVLAWVLVRYRFPGRRLVDALVDLPFALPTAVAGIALTALYSANGWIGRYLTPLNVKVAFTQVGSDGTFEISEMFGTSSWVFIAK